MGEGIERESERGKREKGGVRGSHLTNSWRLLFRTVFFFLQKQGATRGLPAPHVAASPPVSPSPPFRLRACFLRCVLPDSLKKKNFRFLKFFLFKSHRLRLCFITLTRRRLSLGLLAYIPHPRSRFARDEACRKNLSLTRFQGGLMSGLGFVTEYPRKAILPRALGLWKNLLAAGSTPEVFAKFDTEQQAFTVLGYVLSWFYDEGFFQRLCYQAAFPRSRFEPSFGEEFMGESLIVANLDLLSMQGFLQADVNFGKEWSWMVSLYPSLFNPIWEIWEDYQSNWLYRYFRHRLPKQICRKATSVLEELFMPILPSQATFRALDDDAKKTYLSCCRNELISKTFSPQKIYSASCAEVPFELWKCYLEEYSKLYPEEDKTHIKLRYLPQNGRFRFEDTSYTKRLICLWAYANDFLTEEESNSFSEAKEAFIK